MKSQRRVLGDKAEQFVIEHLIADGFTICERNYCKMYGEIDIIATKSELLVFVEVKMRTHQYVSMYEIITPSKQHKIGLVAQEYIVRNKIDNKVARFDVALVQIVEDNFKVTYIPHAFTIDE